MARGRGTYVQVFYKVLSVKNYLYMFALSLAFSLLLVRLALSGTSKVSPSLLLWHSFSACCHCAIQKAQSIMRDIQKDHNGNAASSQAAWVKANQFCLYRLYIEVHLVMKLFSVLFIISGLEQKRSNPENTLDNSSPMRGQITFNIHSLHEKPNWGLTKARCKHLSSKSHIPHFPMLYPSTQ